ncbi:MAG: hypothetical protein SYC29_10280, partial [Planctomycetota bacterium]|nr:hypothetical protein [Planctomycetota bacterium]
LHLPHHRVDVGQMKRPSATITPSTASRMNDSEYLLRRWRDRIGEDEERRVMRIVEAFGIDAYAAQRTMPADRLLH